MDRSDTAASRKSLLRVTIPRVLFFYALVPFLLLWFLAGPIAGAVRLSEPSAFWILLAALAAVGLNWYVYARFHRKRPPLPVFAHGALCLLAVLIIQVESLPAYSELAPTLAAAGASLAMAHLLLISFWLASRASRPAHAAAVGIRILLGVILFGMAYQIFRDLETRTVTRDTWITAGILAAFLLAFNGRRILSAFRRALSRRRASVWAAGTIVQIVGETRLDLDGDPVTSYLAPIEFTVEDELYKTRATISRYTVRRFGRDAFIGREVPVRYNPADPAEAFANRIDKHVFDP